MNVYFLIISAFKKRDNKPNNAIDNTIALNILNRYSNYRKIDKMTDRRVQMNYMKT